MTKKYLNTILIASILITTIFVFFIKVSETLHKNEIPRGDEVAFLETAISIRERGGPLTLVPRMFSGDYREANRHPLYVMFLSTFARRELSFYSLAKGLTALIALIYLGLIFYTMSRLRDVNIALLITFLFATNSYFLEHSAKISTEPLFMIFVLVSWYLIVSRFSTGRADSFKQGVSSALAYLSKVTGIFIILAYVLTTWLTKRQVSKVKNLLFFFLGFFIIALPLLWRNTYVYKNPFYNYNSKLLWIGTGQERRVVDLYEGRGQSFLKFFHAQSLEGISSRIVDGLAGEAVVVTQVVAFSYSRIRGAILLGLLFTIALFRDRKKERGIFSIFLFLAFYGFFSWYYKISGHYRYILPVVFILYFYIASLIFKVLKEISQKFIGRENFSRVFKLLLLGLSVFTFLSVPRAFDVFPPFTAVSPPPDYLEVKAWVEENIDDGELYLNGPGHEYQIEWLTGTGHLSFEMPVTENFSELGDFIEAWNFRYVIISTPTVRGRPVMEDFFRASPETGIAIIKNPPSWELVFEDAERHKKFLIYKILNER